MDGGLKFLVAAAGLRQEIAGLCERGSGVVVAPHGPQDAGAINLRVAEAVLPPQRLDEREPLIEMLERFGVSFLNHEHEALKHLAALRRNLERVPLAAGFRHRVHFRIAGD